MNYICKGLIRDELGFGLNLDVSCHCCQWAAGRKFHTPLLHLQAWGCLWHNWSNMPCTHLRSMLGASLPLCIHGGISHPDLIYPAITDLFWIQTEPSSTLIFTIVFCAGCLKFGHDKYTFPFPTALNVCVASQQVGPFAQPPHICAAVLFWDMLYRHP